jgi:glycogen phosphorylase
VRMANLAIVGSHSTNGVAAIHSGLLRTTTVKDLAEMFPERFNNKTNGVTPRRWLLLSNPRSPCHHGAIGDGWITDLSQLEQAQTPGRRQRLPTAFWKQTRGQSALCRLAEATFGQIVDPDTIFDCQIKRIHEYKRQLLNALRIVVLYNRLRENPGLEMKPRTFFFAGKAAPAYTWPSSSSSSSTTWPDTIDATRRCGGGSRWSFLPEYSVSLAERLIPASDVSNQISTAGYEASGTSNMKFMMNGALTVGTRDGATIEMAEEAGEENFFLFGLTAEQVAGSRGWYNPHWHYENEPETRAALDLIFSDHFSRDEPGLFEPLRDTLLTQGDYYMHLADLTSYCQGAGETRRTLRDPEKWARKAILNVAASGKFSSDRTIAEYASEIWGVKPCPAGTFTEAHILAITQAICDYRRDSRPGWPSLPRQRHACSVRARTANRARGAGRERCRHHHSERQRRNADTGDLAHDSALQPRTQRRISRTASSLLHRTIRPRMAASSTTRPMAALPIRT